MSLLTFTKLWFGYAGALSVKQKELQKNLWKPDPGHPTAATSVDSESDTGGFPACIAGATAPVFFPSPCVNPSSERVVLGKQCLVSVSGAFLSATFYCLTLCAACRSAVFWLYIAAPICELFKTETGLELSVEAQRGAGNLKNMLAH